MKYLVDTHIALWLLADSPQLPQIVRGIADNRVSILTVSIVSLWEVMLKHQAHPDKLAVDAPTFAHDCKAAHFETLGLSPVHVLEAADLPTEGVHKDPFDRMLLAQARVENFTLLTHDRAFAAYDDSHVLLV